MKIPHLFSAIVAAGLTATAGFAQDTGSSPSAAAAANTGQPNDAEMMNQMMEMSKTNENHKLLADLDGNWSYLVKYWMNGDPTSKPQEAKGNATRKSIMGGRYFVEDVAGKMEMPDASGKMTELDFKGMGINGYDNAKKKFLSTWMDNMGTGIMVSEGTYDAASKSFTFIGEIEPLPGMKQPIREVLTVTDKDHMKLEWFEDRGGKEAKTMVIAYTRKK